MENILIFNRESTNSVSTAIVDRRRQQLQHRLQSTGNRRDSSNIHALIIYTLLGSSSIVYTNTYYIIMTHCLVSVNPSRPDWYTTLVIAWPPILLFKLCNQLFGLLTFSEVHINCELHP